MNRQQRLSQLKKQQRREQRQKIKLKDVEFTKAYCYAIEDAKLALSRLGWGEVRLQRFDTMLAQVQQDYGLIRIEKG
jgi:hypothetical protein